MKNKKGYTLIEIIIATALIALIGTISIVSIKKIKQTPEKEILKYIENIKLDAAVYYENNKTNKKFKNFTEKSQWRIIRLGDLISEGLLDGDSINPKTNKTNNDSKDDCIKLFYDSEMNIDVEYLDKEFCLSPEEQPLYINIPNEPFSITLEDSYKMYKENDRKTLEKIQEKIKDGTYIYENFSPPEIDIKDEDEVFYGKLSYTSYIYDETKEQMIYTYKISEDYEYYDRIAEKEKTIIVEYEDDSGPVIVSGDYFALCPKAYKYEPCSLESDDYIDISFNTYYYETIDISSIYNSPISNYSIFDNKDGFEDFELKNYYKKDYLLNYDWTVGLNEEIKLKDKENNESKYDINIYQQYHSEPPIIEYNGPTDFMEDEIYVEYGRIYPIEEYLHIYDNDTETFNFNYYYYDENDRHYDWGELLPAGNYTLWVEASDESNYVTASYNINILSNEPPIIEYNGGSYYMEDEIYFDNGETYPIYEYINVTDPDSEEYYYCYYFYDENGNYYDLYEELPAGNYTLWVEASDESNYITESYNIYIESYSYEEDEYYEDECYYCDGWDCYYICENDFSENEVPDCVSEMFKNSVAWHEAGPEEQDRLNEENKIINEECQVDAHYNEEDGFWYDSYGNLLYDPNGPMPGDYDEEYEDYSYDDYDDDY